MTTTQPISGPSPRYTHLNQDFNSPRPSVDDPFSSLHRVSTSSTSPPPYSASPFTPTLHLQIETPGKPWLSLPLPPRPDPIPIYSLPSPSTPQAQDSSPTYLSLRPTRCSGSSYLTSPASTTPLSTTTYRFGPNRPPVVNLYLPNTGPEITPSDSDSARSQAQSQDDADQGVDLSVWSTFSLQTPTFSRTTTFTTRLGTFSWRYASRAERKELSCHSLLVMERITKISGAQNLGVKDAEERRAVARLVRSDETRSAGSGKSSAGNGGLLEVDLSGWWIGDENEGRGEKEGREMMTVLVVTTALVMLKKEVDRRRAVQIAMIVGGGGGP